MTTPNAELAYRVLDHIDANPEQWLQSRWLARTECGTAGCFAGWAVMLSGGKLVQRTAFAAETYVESGLGKLDGMHVGDAAAELLGMPMDLDMDPSDHPLFRAHNTREDLGRGVAEIFGPRPAVAS